MTIPVPETTTTAPVREIISLILLILGSILVCIGSFLLWSLAGGLFTLGILLTIIAVVIGYNR